MNDFQRVAIFQYPLFRLIGPVPVIPICLSLFLLSSGCSRKEQPQLPVQKVKVVKPIHNPVSQETEIAEIKEKQKAKPENRQGERAEIAAVGEKILKWAETGTKERNKERNKANAEAGYYIVKKGDTIASIAEREEVYGDPLKWPILYRLNMDKLESKALGEDFPDRVLPEGIRLRIITPEEMRTNLKKRANHRWVVNVISATTRAEILPSAIKLMKNGYPVYITRLQIKGKDWMRLRVGFFRSKAEADKEGKKIMGLLSLVDSWTAKIGKELEAFGGY